jgi:hypothetical protein
MTLRNFSELICYKNTLSNQNPMRKLNQQFQFMMLCRFLNLYRDINKTLENKGLSNEEAVLKLKGQLEDAKRAMGDNVNSLIYNNIFYSPELETHDNSFIFSHEGKVFHCNNN